MIITTATTDSSKILPLGRQGEENARQIWFDLTWLIDNFGEGVAELNHQRSKDGAPYPVNNITQESNMLIWTIEPTDTEFDGFGKAEINWIVDDTDTVAKTVIYRTNVLESLAPGREVPDPYESWYDALLVKIGDSQGYAEQAAQSAETAQQAASDAAEETAEAIRTEMSGYANSARQSAESAAQSAQALSGMTVTVGATDKGSGIVEISATVNRG